MKTTWIGLAGLTLLCACSAPSNEDTPEPVALVTVATAVPQTVGETVKLYGIADSGPGGQASLVAPIEARLVAIDTSIGTAVGQGQAVLRLIPGPTATLEIAKARSDVQAATAAYARAQRLRADGLMSDADVETARAAKATASATIQSLTGRSLTLRAPMAGHVEGITARPGDIIAAGTSIASISGNGPARARFGVDPGLVRSIRAGAAVTLARAGALDRFPSHIESVDPLVDPQTRLASVYAILPAASQVRTGEALTGEVVMSGGGSALVIPYRALLDDAGQPFVFVVAKGVANRRDIATGANDGTHVAVLRGLKMGDQVVIDGGTALQDGMKVRLR
ncbi:efflux RND transporter periplasmic adaptor subunit [Sphingobium sp. AN558]|uniref:efflux RND transporter periplasmic adaptor subunit n=1 Tax=Sphingobium sp. AN558 TaxID=3133442 RepID=UPI0030BC8576